MIYLNLNISPLSLSPRLTFLLPRFLTIRHQNGGEYPAIANGQRLDPSRVHVKLQGTRGHVRIRLPQWFYGDIVDYTEGLALIVMVADDSPEPIRRKLQNVNQPVEFGKYRSRLKPPFHSFCNMRRLFSSPPLSRCPIFLYAHDKQAAPSLYTSMRIPQRNR